MTMHLERLRVTAYHDENSSDKVGKDFVVWLNLESYRRALKVAWSDVAEINASDAKHTYKDVCGETPSRKLIFDTTKLVPTPLRSDKVPHNRVINLLEPLIAMRVGFGTERIVPSFLKFSWAQLQNRFVLTNMDITYNLFRPDGTPIRVEADLTFSGFGRPLSSIGRKAFPKSKDGTMIVTVSAGDNPPSLCKKNYKSQLFYLRMAR